MILNALLLLGSALLGVGAIQMPPADSVYTSVSRSRGFFFSPPVDVWFIGARMQDEFPGRQLLDVVLINGPPATFPETTSVTSLFHYDRTDLDTTWPHWICIQPTLYLSAGGFYGLIAGRVQDEQAQNVSYSYASVNNYDSSVDGQFMLVKRLMNQQSIFVKETEFVSTDDEDPLARLEVHFEYSEPTNLPSYCVGIPPNPDDPPTTTTSTSTGVGNGTMVNGTSISTGDSSVGSSGSGRQSSPANQLFALF